MRIYIILAVTFVLGACQTVQQHASAVSEAQSSDDKITVGKVQRSINVGMSSAAVVEVLGSPNIVSTDDKRREVWVYDKVSTTSVHSSSQGGISTLLLGGVLTGGAILGGGLGASSGSSAGAASTSQRTLTIVIKFDDQGKVRDFSYRSSSF
jgi:outer membrane protein assembly factor BamE (lipoprotein component of BamABCDE complex)